MKQKTLFVCNHCGDTTPRWAGQCPSCKEWNTLVEERRVVGKTPKHALHTPEQSEQIKPQLLSDVVIKHEERLFTGIEELDRVLGGGIMPGGVVLVGGDPGIGKSTLLLQLCAGNHFTEPPLYVSGEESPRQIKNRAARLGCTGENIVIYPETHVGKIAETIRTLRPPLVVIDSVQTIFLEELESAPGSVAQVRESAYQLTKIAKALHIPIFFIGHVTKDGTIAGPKVLEHIVDTVLHFEGEGVYSYRILRALKNRYGSTNEIGVFEMEANGLREVSNPSELFLAHRRTDESGSAVAITLEGSRPIALEAQALVAPATFGTPQRSATGIEYRRLQMIIAVLEKRLGARLSQHDVFVNIAGGIKVNDPALDVAIASAIMSSLRDKAIPADTAFVGEIGLTGEVRPVAALAARVNEAAKLGFASLVLPNYRSSAALTDAARQLQLRPVERIYDVIMPLLQG